MHLGQLLRQNVQIALGVILVVLLVSLRGLVKDERLRGDFRGAFFYLGACVGMDLLEDVLRGLDLARELRGYMRALGLLLFCFGLVRLAVGTTIWLFRGRRGKHTPQIVRDVVDATLYAFSLVVVLRATLRVDVTSLVATSAALSVVIGLALQETLGNLFSGLSLQLEHPFQAGDWVQVNEFVGRVVQLAWRGTKLETLRGEQVTVPNSSVAKSNVVNFSRHGHIAHDLRIGVAYRSPPNQVKAVLGEVLEGLPQVLAEPAPEVRVLRYDDSQITYELRFFVQGYENLEQVIDAVLSAVWYRFQREGLEVPFPQRVVQQLERAPALRNVLADADELQDTLSLLERVDFLKPLGPEGRAELARKMRRETFGSGEVILRAGEVGDSFHLLASGGVTVVAHEREVARLERGDFFGEMSLLTGEPRTATVTADGDATLVTMTRADFASVLESHATVAPELADILGRRRAELDCAREGAGGDGASRARAESKRIFGRLRELFKVVEG